MFTMEDGIGPVILFSDKEISNIETRPSIEEGIGPFNLFLLRCKLINLESLPIEEGND